MNNETTIPAAAATTTPIVRIRRGQAYGWDIDKAHAKAAESGEASTLLRPDGTSAGLIVTPEGELRRENPKPQGKAARKEYKKLRRNLRTLYNADSSPTAQKILIRRMADLCRPTP